MVVSFILNTEYMKVEERIKWVIKNASFAVENDVLIVTHEYIKTHMEELIGNMADRFYDDFEMRRFSPEELKKMKICYIPDEIFNEIYDRNKCQSKAILDLTNNRNEKLERFIIKIIDEELSCRGETKPDYIMNCLHTVASIKYIAKYYECSLIPYVFSAVRHVHGYTQTLYMAHFAEDLFNTDVAKEMYLEYEKGNFDFCIFNKKEILALLGKKRNLPLLPMMDIDGNYEMGVISEGFNITPQTYQIDGVTDDDLYFESKRWYKNREIITRNHPMRMDQMGITREYMRDDPVTFVLKCKRLSTVQSQMIIKAAIWNRVPCVLGESLPYAFLFSKDFQSKRPMSDKALNFILFCYFVPDCCMFDHSYWMWRMQNPNPSEIMKYHIHNILKGLGYEESLLYNNKNRLEMILEGRGCCEREIRNIVNGIEPETVNYDYLTSRVQVLYSDGKEANFYCLNKKREEGGMVSCFNVESERNCYIKECDIFLLDDVGGTVIINKVIIDDEEIYVGNSMDYWSKRKSKYTLKFAENDKRDTEIKVHWNAVTIGPKFCY